jgi:anti-sigma regulatory factor (Ser/Thr protein kinase)
MKITISSNSKELRKIRLEVEVYCKANFINFDSSKAILAIDEALQNVMRHAYSMEPDKKIDLSFEKIEEESFKVIIRDYGKQEPLENIKPRDLKDVRPGGLGIYFIKQCSKKSEYKHLPNGIGTELTLVF